MNTFTHDGITLIHGDCMEYLATLEDGAYSLAVVDPPYGIGDFSQSDAVQEVTWNDAIPQPVYFDELKRISKKRVIWGANYYNCFENGRGGLVWYKNIGHPQMSHCEIASVSGQQKVDFVHINWSGGIRKSQNDFCHPCQKPVSLYRFILQNYARPGDTILDTHLGSGSSAIAAWEMGYTFTGIEIDKDYFDAAVERFKKRIMQPYLPGVVHSKPAQQSLL